MNSRLKGIADKEIYGRRIVFEDGREGIIVGAHAGFCWVKSLDGRIAHQYSLDTIRRRILNGNEIFPVQ